MGIKYSNTRYAVRLYSSSFYFPFHVYEELKISSQREREVNVQALFDRMGVVAGVTITYRNLGNDSPRLSKMHSVIQPFEVSTQTASLSNGMTSISRGAGGEGGDVRVYSVANGLAIST